MLQIRIVFDGNDKLVERTVTETKGTVNADRLIKMILKEGDVKNVNQLRRSS